MSWAKLSAILEPLNHSRRIIGFDTFDGFTRITDLDIGAENNEHLREGGFSGSTIKKIQDFIDMGRLKYHPNRMLTTRDLLYAGLISKVGDGIKLLAKNKLRFNTPIHFEVSQASLEAIKRIEEVGGTVTCVHLNELAIRAITKPLKFELLPRRARPPPRLMDYYLDATKCGFLSPEIQQRNMALFGEVTSEERYRREHTRYMDEKRVVWKAEREQKIKYLAGLEERNKSKEAAKAAKAAAQSASNAN